MRVELGTVTTHPQLDATTGDGNPEPVYCFIDPDPESPHIWFDTIPEAWNAVDRRIAHGFWRRTRLDTFPRADAISKYVATDAAQALLARIVHGHHIVFPTPTDARGEWSEDAAAALQELTAELEALPAWNWAGVEDWFSDGREEILAELQRIGEWGIHELAQGFEDRAYRDGTILLGDVAEYFQRIWREHTAEDHDA